MIVGRGFDSSESARVKDVERGCVVYLSSRLRKERRGGFEHLRSLTGVVYISKSWDLLGHGRKKKERQGGLMWPWPCVQGSKANDPTEGRGGSKQSQPTKATHVTASRSLSQLVKTMRFWGDGYDSMVLISKRLVWIAQCNKYNI